MVGPIPRASTFPLLLGGGSPRSSSQLPSWRRAPSGADGGSCLWGRGSRALLIAVVCLYSLVLLGLPALYSSFGSRPGSSGGITAAGSPGIGASSDLPAAALAEGVLQPPQLARALSAGRRSALEGGSGSIAAQLWPGAGRLHYGNTQTAQLPRVEYRDAGNVVALSDALNMSAWQEQELYRADPAPLAQLSAGASRNSSRGGSGGGSSAVGQRFPALCPQGPEVRVFIGVTSRCCTAEAQAKRDAIRRTWMQAAKDHASQDVTIRFILAQPSTQADLHTAMELLRGEVQQHADIIIVPGQDVYRSLPSKTLQLLRYALSSDCAFTHVVKADDDVHLRPQALLDIIRTGRYNFSVDVQHDGSGAFDGQPAPLYQSPWLRGMYVGQLDSMAPGGTYPGWAPNRDPKSKWFLSEDDLPDAWSPLGVRWCSGWGYMLSRDLAEYISNTALTYAAVPDKKLPWWGRMPWEDIMVAAILRGVARVHHHHGFKAAWQDCGAETVVKHLDWDAPALQDGLYAQELSGLWSKRSIVCSSGIFQPNNHSDWRTWRNSLPDNQLNGLM